MSAGYTDLLRWMREHGTVDRVGVESTGSWGAGLTRHLTAGGFEVVEVDRPDRRTRRTEGKTDTVDAIAAARAVISGRATGAPKSRDGSVEAIRQIEIVYHAASKDRTRAINQFKAIIVAAPAGLRHRLRDGLSLRNQLARARRFNDHHPDLVEQQTRFALRELARRIEFLDQHCARLEHRINELVVEYCPALVGLSGVGPHSAARLLAAAGDNPHRLRSEAAFAKLCGVCPMPASSGKTNRHRLNRGGDRRANNALFTIVLNRMQRDPRTRAYVERRTAEGLSKPEIMRCLKRFLAREVYAILVNPPTELVTGDQIRQLRTQHGLSLTTVAEHLSTSATHLSRLERGLTHDTKRLERIRDWLVQAT
jgi:transposase